MEKAVPLLDKLAIIGLGQLGGSFGVAMRDCGLFHRVVGYDAQTQHAQTALQHGLIDALEDSPERLVSDADVIMLCSPLSTMESLFQLIGQHGRIGAVVTDVGSVKGFLLPMATQYMPQQHFVPGHPIAGIERSGPGVANPTLFHHREVILTPLEAHRESQPVLLVQSMWEATHSIVRFMDAGLHDQVFAATSHLAQLLAYAYASLLGATGLEPERLNSRFHKFIRLGGSDTRMWADVYRYNTRPVIGALMDCLDALKAQSVHMDEPDLVATMFEASESWRIGARQLADEIEWEVPDPERGLYALTDILPVMIASAYVHTVALAEERLQTKLYDHLGGGFMGMTRPAVLDHQLATGMLLDNRSAVEAIMPGFRAVLEVFKEAILDSDKRPEKIKERLDEAKAHHLANLERLGYAEGM